MELYQLRIIVAYAIATLFGSLSTIPLVGMLGQREGLLWLGRGTAVRTRVRAVFATITILGLVAFLGTAVTGALALYQIALILMLAMPAGTFVYVVSRIER